MQSASVSEVAAPLVKSVEKGIDLAPVLVEVVVWAARHEDTDAPAATVRDMEQYRDRVLAGIRESWSKTTTD